MRPLGLIQMRENGQFLQKREEKRARRRKGSEEKRNSGGSKLANENLPHLECNLNTRKHSHRAQPWVRVGAPDVGAIRVKHAIPLFQSSPHVSKLAVSPAAHGTACHARITHLESYDSYDHTVYHASRYHAPTLQTTPDLPAAWHA